MEDSNNRKAAENQIKELEVALLLFSCKNINVRKSLSIESVLIGHYLCFFSSRKAVDDGKQSEYQVNVVDVYQKESNTTRIIGPWNDDKKRRILHRVPPTSQLAIKFRSFDAPDG